MGFNELLIPFLSASAKASSALEVAPDALNKEVLESFLKGSVIFLLALNALALFFFLVSIFAPKLLKLPGLSASLLFKLVKEAPQRFLKRRAAKAAAAPADSEPEPAAETASPDVLEGGEKIESIEAPPPEDPDLPPPPDKDLAPSDEAPPETVATEASVEDEATVTDEKTEILDVEEEVAAPPAEEVVEEEIATSTSEAQIEEEVAAAPLEETIEEEVAAPQEAPSDPNEVTEILTHAATPGEIIGTDAEASDPQLEAMVAAAAESAEAAMKEKSPPPAPAEDIVEEEVTTPTPEAQIEEEVAVAEPEIEEEVAAAPPEETIEEEVVTAPDPKNSPDDDASSSAAFEQKTEVLEKSDISSLKLEEELEKALDAPIEETQEAPIFDVSLLDEQLEDDSKA